MERAKKLLNSLKSAPAGRIIFFSDEKTFTVDPVRNRQNERYLKHKDDDPEVVEDEDRFIDKTKHPASLMMLGVVASSGEVCPPVWFPVGYRLVSKDYIAAVEKTVKPWIESVMIKHPGKTYVFQQDGAPAHTAAATQAYLGTSLEAFWPKDYWPPSSPDCNPLDYSIWWHIESKACRRRHNSLISCLLYTSDAADE